MQACAPTLNQTDQKAASELILPDKPLRLNLEEAITYALNHNLDARVSALELLSAEQEIGFQELNAFPSMEFSAGVKGRSNEGASSSRSVISGQQSLEPSTSTDRVRRYYELQAQWNVIDVATAILQSRIAGDEAKIQALRYQLMRDKIMRDVYAAYLQTLYFQQHEKNFERLEQNARQYLDDIATAARQNLINAEMAVQKKSNLTDLLEELRHRQTRLAEVEYELKSLLGVHPQTELILTSDVPVTSQDIHALLRQDLASLENAAIQGRAELAEAAVQTNIAQRERRQAIWQAVPGGELIFAWNRDSNSFLVEPDWFNYSASIVQNLTNLFKLPKTLDRADTQIEIKQTQYDALALAILFQVHLSYRQVDFSAEEYSILLRDEEIYAKKMDLLRRQYKDGLIAKGKLLEAELANELLNMDMADARYDAHNAYLQMMEAVGRPVLPEIVQGG